MLPLVITSCQEKFTEFHVKNIPNLNFVRSLSTGLIVDKYIKSSQTDLMTSIDSYKKVDIVYYLQMLSFTVKKKKYPNLCQTL